MTGTDERDASRGAGMHGGMVGGTLAAAIGTAALAGLLFGFDTAVIAGVTTDLTGLFALSPETLGITVSAALWGTLVGAMFAGKPGDAIGSRNSLRVLAAFYFVAGLGCALGASTHWFMNALIAGLFPVLVTWSPGAPFAIFAVAMVVQFVVVAAVFPETRGVDLDEMAERLQRA